MLMSRQLMKNGWKIQAEKKEEEKLEKELKDPFVGTMEIKEC